MNLDEMFGSFNPTQPKPKPVQKPAKDDSDSEPPKVGVKRKNNQKIEDLEKKAKKRV
jgi:hypothetical protein